VKVQPQWVVTPGKQQQQTGEEIVPPGNATGF
jgi:hypothetical protein